jgi:aryl-alcohol dehydrogenase-like predicted oxidoreductase
VVICTKVSGSSARIGPQLLRPALEASLRRLRRETVDVYLLHNLSTEQVQDPAMQEALEALRREGLIRAYGAPAWSPLRRPSGGSPWRRAAMGFWR